jgi:epoxyqueuosine reductase
MIDWLEQKARKLDFDLLGITNDFQPEHKDYFLNWLKQGKQAEMSWLNRNTDKRLNPALLLENLKSIIVLGKSYNHKLDTNKEYIMGRYAYGQDYHDWFKDKIKDFLKQIEIKNNNPFKARVFVDTGPLLERDLAMKAGIGWMGKNTCLINKKYGSFFFIGLILTDLELKPSVKGINHCGLCDNCLKACPTEALTPYGLDATKCLAYHNIEKKGLRDRNYWGKFGKQLIGCDICQDVCPYNKKAILNPDPEWLKTFVPYDLGGFSQILKLTIESYKTKVNKSAISRLSYVDFMRNVFLVIANNPQKELIEDIQNWQKQNLNLELEEYQHCIQVLRQESI